MGTTEAPDTATNQPTLSPMTPAATNQPTLSPTTPAATNQPTLPPTTPSDMMTNEPTPSPSTSSAESITNLLFAIQITGLCTLASIVI